MSYLARARVMRSAMVYLPYIRRVRQAYSRRRTVFRFPQDMRCQAPPGNPCSRGSASRRRRIAVTSARWSLEAVGSQAKCREPQKLRHHFLLIHLGGVVEVARLLDCLTADRDHAARETRRGAAN